MSDVIIPEYTQFTMKQIIKMSEVQFTRYNCAIHDETNNNNIKMSDGQHLRNHIFADMLMREEFYNSKFL